MRILVNAFGISSAGGITVLQKTINEFIDNPENHYDIYIFSNKNTCQLVDKFKHNKNIHFKVFKDYGILIRVLRENLYFFSFALINNVSLIYNFSGTNQLFSVTPRLLKVQNILFFTKKLDKLYFDNNSFFLWLRQIWFKRFIFLLMIRFAKNIEIQSIHVKKELSNFINIENKSFFLKNDCLSNQNDVNKSKQYNFDKEITFLYIVGPHFSLLYKNLSDFVNAMSMLLDSGLNFKIDITLTYDELNQSGLWDDKLNKITSFLGYIENDKRMKELFADNVILISTSITETLGLHVIEATLNGIVSIVPNELYTKDVYGSKSLSYNLFESKSLKNIIMKLKTFSNQDCHKLIVSNQKYIIQNEKKKYNNCVSIFNDILAKEK